MKKIIVMFALGLGGCGTYHDPNTIIDPQLTPAFNEYVDDARAHGLDPDFSYLIMDVGNVGNEEADGVCRLRANAFYDVFKMAPHREIIKHITVTPQAAYVYSYPRLRSLIYHELGHCLWQLQHSSESDYQNIMNPYGSMAGSNPKTWETVKENYWNAVKAR